MGLKTIAIRGSIGLISLGGVSFVAHKAYQALNKEEKQKKINLDLKIKDSLVSNGFELININAEEKIWKIAWNEIDNDASIKTTEATVNDYQTLKEWCIETYEKSQQNQEELEKVKKLCIQPPKNIAEKLSKKGKKFTSDWGAKLTSLKTGDSDGNLLKKLKTTNTGLENLDTPETANKALETWCNSKKILELPQSGGVAEYEEVVSHCVA